MGRNQKITGSSGRVTRREGDFDLGAWQKATYGLNWLWLLVRTRKTVLILRQSFGYGGLFLFVTHRETSKNLQQITRILMLAKVIARES